jgi:prepilin-type N-terminal cleavage/methylation domain-containing protein
MSRQRERGFTLLELLLALSIVATLLAITFGGLRVGLAAWRQGEDRAEAQQHARSLVEVLRRSLAATHPYQVPPPGGGGGQPTVLFEGDPERLSFVTTAPPFPMTVPIAFTAVTFALEGSEAAGLAVRQKPLPNTDPFERLAPVLLDASVTAMTFRYLRDVPGSWEERWDTVAEQRLPRAVQVTIATSVRGRVIEHPPFTVPILAGTQ